jgi:deoxycytidylate deaminase
MNETKEERMNMHKVKYTLLQNVVRFATKYSHDPIVKVGACVEVEGKKTFGTNRFYRLPEGMTKEEVVKDRALKLEYITHAEVDAITLAKEVNGGCIYVNYTPCDKCAQKIVESGIKKVVAMKVTEPEVIAKWSKYWVVGQQILKDGGVEFVEQ